VKKQSWVLFLAGLALMAGGVFLLEGLHSRQKLGNPGVRTRPLPGSIRLEAELPEKVLDYGSKAAEIDSVTLKSLPADTSFGYRQYQATDGFELELRVVLMGSDRTSLHKPQFCLTGSGWRIDTTSETRVPMREPLNYDLPVVKLFATLMQNGHPTTQHAVYVYWYVAEDKLSASALGIERMWWMARKLVATGVLQRWAYVSCFATCSAGQEEATFDRIQKFMAAAVPQFQLTPKPTSQTVAVRDPR
jgi:hypothetical protein